MPKRGAAIKATRRSRSFLLPVISAWTGRGEAESAGVRRHVVHAPVGDHDGAGDAVGRHIGQRRAERGEEPRAVGFAVRLAGLDHAHVEARNTAQSLDHGLARLFGLAGAVAEGLAWTLVHHHDRDRAQWIAVFAGERRVGERQHDQREPGRAHGRAAAARDKEQQRQHGGRSNGRPENLGADERGERETEIHVASYWPSRSSSAGTCTWSAL